jgi:hypothetical protein
MYTFSLQPTAGLAGGARALYRFAGNMPWRRAMHRFPGPTRIMAYLGIGMLAVSGIGFATYAAVFRCADDTARHRAWALRLFVLVLGSLIYRVHYTLW